MYDDNGWDTPVEEPVPVQVEDPGEPVVEEPVKKVSRSRSRRGRVVTRRQAEAVLDRLDALTGASRQERESLAVVLGVEEDDARSLTVALASGTEPRNASALADLLDVAEADPGDRDMVALTLGIGSSGMKRLRAAWTLAVNLGLAQGQMSTSPVKAGRELAAAAGEAWGTLSGVRDLLG